jgi:hypothetical protein
MRKPREIVRALSKDTRDFVESMNALQQAPTTNAQKMQIADQIAMKIPAADRARILKEAQDAAHGLQFYNTTIGNRATRRKMLREGKRNAD